jgi:hypothetical protein
MSDLSYLLIYKTFCLITGLVFSYFGYSLFIKGYDKPAGDIGAGYNKFTLTIK